MDFHNSVNKFKLTIVIKVDIVRSSVQSTDYKHTTFRPQMTTTETMHYKTNIDSMEYKLFCVNIICVIKKVYQFGMIILYLPSCYENVKTR
jgi:hypothetical protein